MYFQCVVIMRSNSREAFLSSFMKKAKAVIYSPQNVCTSVNREQRPPMAIAGKHDSQTQLDQ